jgi:hypothetical protein
MDQQALSGTKGGDDWVYAAKPTTPPLRSPQELNPSGGVHEMASNAENMRYELADVSSPALGGKGDDTHWR